MAYETFGPLLAEIAFEYLNIRDNVSYGMDDTVNQGYLTEADISLRLLSLSDPLEREIYPFLWRVQRYFIEKQKDEAANSEDKTLKTLDHICEFMAAWKTHSPVVRDFFYHHSDAIHLLMFGLLVTDNQQTWDDCLELSASQMAAMQPESLHFLLWCYDFYFKDPELSCELFWAKFRLVYPDFSVDSTNITFQLFKFIAAAKWYRDNPTQLSNEAFPGLFVKTEVPSFVKTLELLLSSGLVILWSGQNKRLVQQISMPLGLNFLSHFKAKEDDPTLVFYASDRMQLIIKNLIFSYTENCKALATREQALGICELLLCTIGTRDDLYRAYLTHAEGRNKPRTLQNFTSFAYRLFELGLHIQAFRIFDSVLDFEKLASKESLIEDNTVLPVLRPIYLLAMFIDAWLCLRESCEGHRLGIVKSCAAEIKRIKFKPAAADVFKGPVTTLLKAMCLHIQSPEGKKFIALGKIFIDAFGALYTVAELNSLNKLLKAPPPKKVVKKPPEALKVKIAAAAEVPKVTVPPAPPAPKLVYARAKAALFQPPRHEFSRKQLPKALLDLVDELIKTHPEAYFYLTGGAVLDILSGKIPKDYDVMIFGLSFDTLTALFTQWGIPFEMVGKKHPVVTCIIDGVSIDFSCSAKVVQPGDIWAHLKADFESRLFNLSALYVHLNQSDMLTIFSCSGAMSSRNKRLISANIDPVVLLETKPWALIRLAYVQSKHTNYKPNQPLVNAISELDRVNWLNSFSNFCPFFTACFTKLFSRYPLEHCNRALQDLGVLHVLTGLTLAQANAAIKLVPENLPAEKRYSYWLYALTLCAIRDKAIENPLPIARILCLSPQERTNLKFVHAHIPTFPFEASDDEMLKALVSTVLPTSTYCAP